MCRHDGTCHGDVLPTSHIHGLQMQHWKPLISQTSPPFSIFHSHRSRSSQARWRAEAAEKRRWRRRRRHRWRAAPPRRCRRCANTAVEVAPCSVRVARGHAGTTVASGCEIQTGRHLRHVHRRRARGGPVHALLEEVDPSLSLGAPPVLPVWDTGLLDHLRHVANKVLAGNSEQVRRRYNP